MSAQRSAVRTAARAAPELISVIIPVLNGEEHLGEQLEALASQTYRGWWEIVIADNGCTDGSLAVVERWRDRLPSLRVADASGRKGLNHARNVGVAAAAGDFVAFCDADDVATRGWLEALAEAAPFADLVGGKLELETLNGPELIQPRPGEEPGGPLHGFLPSVSGGNCGMWASVARELGWNEAFTFGSSDVEFSWRAGLATYRFGVAPNALVRRRQRHRLAAVFRQWYAYGESDVQLYRHFREQGMPRPATAIVLEEWSWLVLHSPALLRSRGLRTGWVARAAQKAGRVGGSIRYRVLFL